MEKKISVIIPVYNVEKYLRECLDSVISQTLEEIEIVCVNDGSRDGSRDILSEYEKKDARIVVVDKENGGQSAARNLGLSISKGKYIYFLDSDDFLNSREALKELYQKAEENNLDQLFFDAEVFFENSKVKEQNINYVNYYTRKKNYPNVKTGKELFCEFQTNWDFKVSVCLQLFRKEFLQDYGLSFCENMVHEDEVFTLECSTLSTRSAYIDRTYFSRRVRDNSTMTTSQKVGSIYGYYHGVEELLRFAKKHNSIFDEPFVTLYLQRVLVLMELGARLYAKDDDIEKREILNGVGEDEKFSFAANIQAWEKSVLLKDRIKMVQNEKKEAHKKIQVMTKQMGELIKEKQESESSKKKLEKELEDIKQSTSYKAGRVVTWGPRKAKKVIKSLRGKN